MLANPEDIRDYYIAVEPSIIDAQNNTLDDIELRLADYVEDLEGVADSSKRLEIIMGIVEKIVSVDDHISQPASSRKKIAKMAAVTKKRKNPLPISPKKAAKGKYILLPSSTPASAICCGVNLKAWVSWTP